MSRRSSPPSRKWPSCRFSRMCAPDVAPGMTATPWSSAHRSMICASVAPLAFATFATASLGHFRDEHFAPPKDWKPVTAIPRAWHHFTSSLLSLGTQGPNWIWLTAGGSPPRASICARLKFETPMFRTFPASRARCRPVHTSCRSSGPPLSAWEWRGWCISIRSRYASPSSARLLSTARSASSAVLTSSLPQAFALVHSFEVTQSSLRGTPDSEIAAATSRWFL
mmetsp:Transcript_99967/g.282927  ORF Transcript_99967/g.282927 Transcript_99967/m.282927 type:complete len:224 (-) Transcript_99967:157-828(-)